jgi:hypothetical protein
MGGHAARYYGVSRNTVDYDLHLSIEAWGNLHNSLLRSEYFAQGPLEEGPSWRPADFRRFRIGRLEDGRDEWLEFWRHNHLLLPFEELFRRREVGHYGGRTVPFFSLPDLIRSKETERESDWQDITLLEEILDSRNLSRSADVDSKAIALSQLRSRRGFRRAIDEECFSDSAVVAHALQTAASPITRAWLLPALSGDQVDISDSGMIGEILSGPIRATLLASNRHLALVEAVRRLYKSAAIAADRADKLGRHA